MSKLTSLFAKTQQPDLFEALIGLLQKHMTAFDAVIIPPHPRIDWTIANATAIVLTEVNNGAHLFFQTPIYSDRRVEKLASTGLAAYREAKNTMLIPTKPDVWPPELEQLFALAEPTMRKGLRIPKDAKHVGKLVVKSSPKATQKAKAKAKAPPARAAKKPTEKNPRSRA